MTPADGIPQIAEVRAPEVSRTARRLRQHDSSRSMLERENERLRARVAQLEREVADVEAFAAVAAHELVEPLVLTEAYAAMVSDRLDDDLHADSRRDLDALGRGAARMRVLVETLLHEARSAGHNLSFGPVDLDVVVGDCLSLLAPEIEARGARVEIGELPVVWGEETLLGGVFSNLLINALKFSPRHGSTIRIGAVEEASQWRLWVESQGPSIPVEDRSRIFNPFHRGRGERRARGAGLGLAICRRIVERHGGEIGVTAVNGGGNRFYFTLPRV
jgi:signal transduction histidine kinase